MYWGMVMLLSFGYLFNISILSLRISGEQRIGLEEMGCGIHDIGLKMAEEACIFPELDKLCWIC